MNRKLFLSRLILPAVLGLCILLLAGCSIKDVLTSVGSYFSREASLQEETPENSIESRLFSTQVYDITGEPMTKAGGEPVTILAAYETAAGGEIRINEKGMEETWPAGQVMTYQSGEPVTGENAEEETYAGGEPVTDLWGNHSKDADGNPITRAAGEIVTHGDSEIVYDSEGNKVYHTGEPLTYAPGELMYNNKGELIYSWITFLQDESGQPATMEDGSLRYSPVQLVRTEKGQPITEEDGEAATKVLDPIQPEKLVDQPVEEGSYYIHNLASNYVYFSAPLVLEENITVPAGAEPEVLSASALEGTAEEAPSDESPEDTDQDGADTEEFSSESPEDNDTGETGDEDTSADHPMIRNLQLEILGGELPSFDLRFDAEGYAYFVLQDTELVLGFDGRLRNGANVRLQEMEKTPYPQYAYWDNPPFSLEDHQRWLVLELEDGYYEICSAADPEYCLTVDDQNGIHYANIMLWKYEEKEQQKFLMETEIPRVETPLEEGTYFIRTGLHNWMMLSIGDENFTDERSVYLYLSDGMDGQQFTISYDEYGLATIAHSYSTKVLSVQDGAAVNNQTVFQYEADGGDWQKWILEPVPDSSAYIIRSARNVSEVLNVPGNFAAQLQPVQLYWNDNTRGQNWYFMTEPPEGILTYEDMERYAQQFYSDTGYLILINSITNHVGVYTGYKDHWSCIQYWDCVTGKPSTPTVQGEFTIIGRIPSFDGDTDSPELYTCYYATNFYEDYYFHSIVYYAGTQDIMDASMGVSVSHGCVRLYIDYAQWIYETVPDGTKVVSF